MYRHARLIPLIALLVVPRASANVWTPFPVDTRSGAGLSSSLRIAPDGSPRLAYWIPSAPGLGYAVFDGAEWQIEPVPLWPAAPTAATVTAHPEATQLSVTIATALAVDASGTPWIASVRHDCFGDCSGPVLVTHRDGAGWFTETLETATLETLAGRHDIAVAPGGVVWVAYAGSAGVRAARREGGVWTYEDAAAAGSVQQLRIGPNGEPRLLLHGGPASLQIAARSPGGWQSREVPLPAGELQRATLALAPGGLARIAGELRLPGTSDRELWWFEELPDGGWHSERVTEAGTAVHEPVIALGPAGDGRIAFRDLATLRARLVRHEASTWSAEDVDSALTTTGTLAAEVDAGGTTWVVWPAGGFGLHSAGALGVTDVAPSAEVAPLSVRIDGPHPARTGDGLRLAITSPVPDRVLVEAFDIHGRRLAAEGPIEIGAGVRAMRLPVPARAGVVLVRATAAAGGRAVTRVVLLD